MLNFPTIKHPISRLNWAWKCIVIGTLILPLFPSLGELSFGLALISIWKQEFKHIIKQPLTLGLGFFSLWLIITCFFAYKPGEAFLGLANFLPFIGLFLAFRFVIRETQQLLLLGWLIILPAIPIVLLGLSQLYLGWYSPKFLPPIIGWTLRINGVPEGRMSSVFIYANLLAIYLLIVLIISFGLWINNYQNLTKNLPQKRLNLIFLSTVIFFDIIGLILTHSRNGWAIALLAFIVFSLYLNWYWLTGLITFIITIVSGASFGDLPGQEIMRKIVPAYFWKRISDEMYQNRPLETLRITQWRFCLKMTGDRPLFGWGLRNFTPFYELEKGVYLGHPHNLFLMFSAETGVFGILSLLAIVGFIFFQAIQTLKNLAKNNQKEAHLILFTYLITFSACTLFNCLDVSIFDLRINTISWFLLACISGVSSTTRMSE